MGNCWFKWRNISTFSQSPNSNPVEEIEERRGDSDLLISSDNSRQVENLHRYAVRNPPIAFTSEEMKSITRPNSRLGGGGFGSVYQGFISKDITREEVVKALGVGDEPLRVAVKVHDGDDSFQGHKEWLAEVIFLGQLSHPNLVKLIGYCCEGDKMILVYEYMPLGNVEEKLFTRVLVPLSWPVRMKIAIGAARGLAFLHGTRQPIIYRDFKTSNILLDHEYNAKLSDFGLAKDGPVGDESHVSTRIMGTYGYVAPEYVMTGHLTAGSDVYGFGVVLLELLTGRRTLDMARPAGEQNLVEWAVPMLKEKKKLVGIVDPRLEANYPTRGVHKAAMLAHCCLNRNPKARPTMRDVVYSLEPLQLPVDITHSIIKSPTEC